ncbi:BRISC complex subunit Abraxas 2-like [Branchiostoma lanceolatum]|uniref:BRISC complex subunit Abraxas 2-like n=1 Tax=Branchiostoma lanceolatum TaxID=7740 RepID=UPI0034538652
MAVVRLGGSVFSALSFQQVCSHSDQIGLLFGEVSVQVKDSISDSQINSKTTEKTTCVLSHLPCHLPLSSNLTTESISKAITEVASNREKNIVGWYRFRRNSSPEPSLWERIVHRKLSETLKAEENMLFWLFTYQSSGTVSTHVTDYTLYQQKDRRLQAIPHTVVNLGDTSHDHYRMSSAGALSTDLGMLGVFRKYRDRLVDGEGQLCEVSIINQMNSALQAQLLGLCDSVHQGEKEASVLEEEVAQLQSVLRKATEQKEQQQPSVLIPEKVDISKIEQQQAEDVATDGRDIAMETDEENSPLAVQLRKIAGQAKDVTTEGKKTPKMDRKEIKKESEPRTKRKSRKSSETEKGEEGDLFSNLVSEMRSKVQTPGNQRQHSRQRGSRQIQEEEPMESNMSDNIDAGTDIETEDSQKSSQSTTLDDDVRVVSSDDETDMELGPSSSPVF